MATFLLSLKRFEEVAIIASVSIALDILRSERADRSLEPRELEIARIRVVFSIANP